LPGENVKKFIIKLDELLKLYSVKDTELKRVLHSVLKGPAKEHFRLRPNDYVDWTASRVALKDTFLSSTYDAEAKIELLKRKQKDKEPMAEYLADIKLLNDCLVTPLTVGELLQIATKNVHPKYYKEVRRKNFNSLDEIRKVGQELEYLAYEKEHFHDDEPKAAVSSSFAELRCYGCDKPEETLKSCECEAGKRYRNYRSKAPSRGRTASLSPARRRSPKKVTFQRDSSEDRSSKEKRSTKEEDSDKEDLNVGKHVEDKRKPKPENDN